MLHRRLPARSAASLKALMLAICLAGVGAGLALRPVPGGPAHAGAVSAVRPDTVTFDVRYSGPGPEGTDMLWRARAARPLPGQATIRMEYAGDPADRGMPIWPVSAWVTFVADDPRNSFAAELSGSVNWRSGVVRVAGLVSAGDGRDTPVDHRMRIAWPGLHGTATLVFHRRSP
jgi:hypothetical protein